MKPVTDIEIAKRLPIKDFVPQFRKVVAVEMSDNAILMFRGDDGKTYTIDYDEDGPYRTEI